MGYNPGMIQAFRSNTEQERRGQPGAEARAIRIAVLVPCYNEESTIATVVGDFRTALPDAAVYVYDNNSTDNTVEVATQHGAVVRREHLQGKGHVVRRMFADVEADVFILVDGDDTYDAAAAPRLVEHLLKHGLDMVTGKRIAGLGRGLPVWSCLWQPSTHDSSRA